MQITLYGTGSYINSSYSKRDKLIKKSFWMEALNNLNQIYRIYQYIKNGDDLIKIKY